MQLAHITTRPPHLTRVLEALAQRADHQEAAENLIKELSSITVLVARKFTNDRTADGMLEAFYLTVGCISLGIAQAGTPESGESNLSFLLQHGAEHVFQMGFRHIKELSSLPYLAYLSDFDRDPFEQQRNVKLLFSKICRAEPGSTWRGEDIYKNELLDRKKNQKTIGLALWLRKNHFAGPVRKSDLDANAVIAIAVIFAILGDGRIVARTGQKEIENMIHRAREVRPDIEAGWNELLKKTPLEFQPLLRERMDEYRSTIVKKILSKTSIKRVIIAIQESYAGDEAEVEYD